MLRLCWNCACTSEFLYLHRLCTLESPALSFRGARTGKLGGAQRPTPTFLQTAIIRVCLVSLSQKVFYMGFIFLVAEGGLSRKCLLPKFSSLSQSNLLVICDLHIIPNELVHARCKRDT